MSLRILIPVKPFEEAKQRLASFLSPPERSRLAEKMFRHVFATASAFAGPDTVVVVSRGPDVLDYARTQGATALHERTPSELNSALHQAAAVASDAGASRLLVLASDLPLLQEADLAALAAHDCAIAPDRHERGTNALIWPTSLEFQFGESSFERHRTIAKTAGYEAQIIIRPGLAHDVDSPGDLLDQ